MTFRAPSRAALRLFLTAMSILFVELLLIRWIPANVIYVGFFRNFLLMASFLGIGLGILWGRDPRRIRVSPFGPLLLALVVLVTQVQIVIHLDSPDEIFALGASHGADTNFIILSILVILTTVIMAGAWSAFSASLEVVTSMVGSVSAAGTLKEASTQAMAADSSAGRSMISPREASLRKPATLD